MLVGNLCLEFLNSEWGDFRGRFRRDQLEQPAWVQDFLKRWGLEVAEPFTAEHLKALVDLRSVLRQIFETLPAGEPPREALDALNRILLGVPPVRRLVWSPERGYELEEAPAVKDWRWVMTEIAAAFADLLVNSEKKRLKVCQNPYCRGYYYDDTKSGTQRWCIPQCANLWKARRFRARQRGPQANGSAGNERQGKPIAHP